MYQLPFSQCATMWYKSKSKKQKSNNKRRTYTDWGEKNGLHLNTILPSFGEWFCQYNTNVKKMLPSVVVPQGTFFCLVAVFIHDWHGTVGQLRCLRQKLFFSSSQRSIKYTKKKIREFAASKKSKTVPVDGCVCVCVFDTQ